METKFWSVNKKRRDDSEDLRVHGRIILEVILEKQDSSDSGQGPVAGSSEMVMNLWIP